MDMAFIGTALSTLKEASEIAKIFSSGSENRDEAIRLRQLLISVQEQVLQQQEQSVSDAKRIGDLEVRIKAMEAWDEHEAERWKLVNVDGSASVYALRKVYARGELPHFLCAQCFQHRRKSILTPDICSLGGKYPKCFFKCPECKSELQVTHVRRQLGYAENYIPK